MSPRPAAEAEPAGGALLSVEHVDVVFGTGGRATHAVRDVSWSVGAGEVVAVVGESGSGKTVTAMSLLGLLPSTAHVGGRALLRGRDLFALDPEELRRVRGGEVAMVFQEPMSALNPVLSIGDQLTEAVRVHSGASRAAARERAVELLTLVRLPDPAGRMRAYPHEMSGGQLQRVVIAMAVANDPALLVADEPTTALDVTVQAEVLQLLRDLTARTGTSVLLITHDMGVVADLADRVVVMRAGRVVEQGPVRRVLRAPQEEYTRELLAAVLDLPAAAAGAAAGAPEEGVLRRGAHVAVTSDPATRSVPEAGAVQDEPVLAVRGLEVVFGGRFGSAGVRAVDGIDLHVARGEVLGLVGESGSGKSTVAGCVSGLVRRTGGTLSVAGVDPESLRGRPLRRLRSRVGVVFQDPLSSLDPRASAADSIAEPLLLHSDLRGAALTARVQELLESVALPVALGQRFPHELSGGQRQRVSIARAIALEPELLLADEPTSALDVSVQARVLDLLAGLRAELGFACLFISHDLAVVGRVADRVAVLHRGRLVEQGPTADVLSSPLHPYTQRLVAAAPVADPDAQRERRLAWQGLARA
ncbi:ABC transporter ATP-binding protein [Kineococcus rubinsiae]|uniref:ABC transporter ATP-binding protein n=1 Tax=Kineococcus rubinsiae TaxID=2609562 RepID=UPI0027E50638|nr:ABC transporter ATP-binding protein [Kineococcus rubinsiae]NIZ93582.1 ABC transporter ATP-binding protein [Kineococcus rubinsiae]